MPPPCGRLLCLCRARASVIQGEIGPSGRKDVAVIGDMVTAASRIESATDPMRMGISEVTHDRRRDPTHFRESRTLQVKNRSAPVKIFLSELPGDSLVEPA
ncbi:MAG: hypothetical protein ACYC23_21535 [Limisphaerales bacterium]